MYASGDEIIEENFAACEAREDKEKLDNTVVCDLRKFLTWGERGGKRNGR